VLVDNNPDIKVICGNCLDVMAFMDAESVDSIVTDPPYGLSFMGKDWDHGVPGTHFWKEALRVAKPGTHLLAFGGTRTFHRLAVAIEDAGWEIRDTIMWVYGEGFPKSLDVGKAFDKRAGAERKKGRLLYKNGKTAGGERIQQLVGGAEHYESFPVTDLAKKWDGWGTALKPAYEPIIMARKPFKGAVAENVLRYGTGALNIDACRIKTNDDLSGGTYGGMFGYHRDANGKLPKAIGSGDKGRFPANLIHDGSDEVIKLFPIVKRKEVRNTIENSDDLISFNQDSAARFFYCAKASRTERNAGCEDLTPKQRDKSRNVNQPSMNGGEGNPYNRGVKPVFNHHPTVKPIALMRYLVRLVTPPNGIVLDPFCGSGSTGVAAVLEGFRFIGIDISEEYCEIAKHRIDYAIKEKGKQRTLF